MPVPISKTPRRLGDSTLVGALRPDLGTPGQQSRPPGGIRLACLTWYTAQHHLLEATDAYGYWQNYDVIIVFIWISSMVHWHKCGCHINKAWACEGK